MLDIQVSARLSLATTPYCDIETSTGIAEGPTILPDKEGPGDRYWKQAARLTYVQGELCGLDMFRSEIPASSARLPVEL